jgi:uncharacterized membrane protein YadS
MTPKQAPKCKSICHSTATPVQKNMDWFKTALVILALLETFQHLVNGFFRRCAEVAAQLQMIAIALAPIALSREARAFDPSDDKPIYFYLRQNRGMRSGKVGLALQNLVFHSPFTSS